VCGLKGSKLSGGQK